MPGQTTLDSSLTEEAIRDGFANLKDQAEFQPLYEAGLSRAIGDWTLGMNATRLYTLKYGQNKQVLSIGRVQTPTLALIVKRQQEIEHFVPKQYWELKTVYRDTVFSAIVRKSDEELAEEAEKEKENPSAKKKIQPDANRGHSADYRRTDRKGVTGTHPECRFYRNRSQLQERNGSASPLVRPDLFAGGM